MTEEEQEKYDENDNFQNKFCSDEQALRIECEAEKTKFLLSKHFDLFGLIEAGLAVNAAELNSVSSHQRPGHWLLLPVPNAELK